ncbi:hypothetical protein DL771_002357 [Monosporascus sp. 5C6A]|nr:hypothetical protein DL771_002357 [Monosporascus sp. 5C6A]
MSSSSLTAPQLRALLDILVHHETYSEVEFFKSPDAIDHYGYPFTANAKNGGESANIKSSTPLLQLLLTRLLLPIPGLRDLSSEFWNVKFRGIMLRLCEADLSESYDKGTLGSRKRLATAASVIHAAITRGLLAGVSQGGESTLQSHYDSRTAEGVTNAYHASMYQLVYGDLVDDLFDYATKTDNLDDHSPAVRAAVDYAIIHIATLLHCIFSLSAEGPYLLKLLENTNSLIPYSVLGQTLRIGNAASMMNGLARLILAKVSVGAVTNWLGLTQNAPDGMNLLQRIISLTLEWDASDFRKAAEKIKKNKDRASDECFAAIDRHTQSNRAQHDSIREASKTQKLSIVIAILESADKKLPDKLTDFQHSQLLEYYSARLAIRDREMIVDALCRQNPDFTTSVLKEVLAVFDPMIRAIHQNVDLRKHLGSLQKLLADLIKTGKPKKSNADNKQQDAGSVPPSVDDYVDLLRRNRYMLFEYLHDVAKGCPELRETWRAWAKHAVQAFRHDARSTDASRSNDASDAPEPKTQDLSAGSMDVDLKRLFDRVPAGARNSALAEIDAHAKYLQTLEEISAERMQRILDGPAESRPGTGRMSGPGMYLAQWQSLLDNTIITPESKQGPLRRGKHVKGLKASGKTEALTSKESWDPNVTMAKEEKSLPEAPDVTTVIAHLAPQFKKLVAEKSSKGLES